MAKKELQNTNVVNENENENGAEGRRSFMKGMVAGSVAVGAMATTIAAATPANAATAAQLPYTLLGRVGCLNCGLGGIDIELRLDELINPANGGFAAVVEGEILQR